MNTTANLYNNHTTPWGVEEAQTGLAYTRIVQIGMHTAIFIGGVLGNSLIMTVIMKARHLQSITNWFVLNLAICNLFIAAFVITLSNLVPFIDWPFGEAACKYLLIPVLEHFAGVCVLTHTALGVVRFVIIQNALKGVILKVRYVGAAIVGIWFVAFVTMSATLMGPLAEFHVIRQKKTDRLVCAIKWVDSQKRLLYRFIIFVLTYIVPMVVTAFTYYQIHRTVDKSLKHLSGHTSVEMLSKRRRKSRRMNRVLTTMYIAFGLTTLPLQVLYFLADLKVLPKAAYIRIVWLILVGLFYSQIVTNPLILFYMGKDYRKELFKLSICHCLSSPNRRMNRSNTIESRMRASSKLESSIHRKQSQGMGEI